MAKKPSYLIEYIDKYKRWRDTHRDEDENGDSSGEEKYVLVCNSETFSILLVCHLSSPF
jgi:hypothetical protein